MPTIKRWLKRRRQSGDVEPKPIPDRPSRKGAIRKSWLPKHLEANHDLTLEEHREALVKAIGRALAAVTPEDMAGWFDHVGYEPQDQPV